MGARPAAVHAGAAAWGLAEATLFVIVPDVLLSRVALHRARTALAAGATALGGALVGGTAMWAWGRSDPAAAQRALDALPGIGPGLVATVGVDLADRGLAAMLLGPLRGVPYKVFAAQWGAGGGGLGALLLWSVPARLVRFWAVTLLAAAVRRTVCARLSLRAVRWTHAACWVLFYAAYFALFDAGEV